jgi:hypothetical protein
MNFASLFIVTARRNPAALLKYQIETEPRPAKQIVRFLVNCRVVANRDRRPGHARAKVLGIARGTTRGAPRLTIGRRGFHFNSVASVAPDHPHPRTGTSGRSQTIPPATMTIGGP